MRNRFLALAALILLVVPMHPAHSSDSEMLDYILSQAQHAGRTQCNAAIKDAFRHVFGDDVRVHIDSVPGFDSFKVTVVFGYTGDTIVEGVDFRVLGGQCFYSKTAVIHTIQTCRDHHAEYNQYSIDSESLGVLFATNRGGGNLIMTPSDHGGCTLVYMNNGLK